MKLFGADAPVTIKLLRAQNTKWVGIGVPHLRAESAGLFHLHLLSFRFHFQLRVPLLSWPCAGLAGPPVQTFLWTLAAVGQGPICRRCWSQLTFRGELGAGAVSNAGIKAVDDSVALSNGSLGAVSQICCRPVRK